MNVNVSDLAWFIPLCGLISAAIVAAIRWRPALRTADEAVTAAQWQRLHDEILRLDGHIEDCHAERDKAREERDEARRERDEERAEKLMWKAAAEGLGIVRTAQTIAEAETRLADDKNKKE